MTNEEIADQIQTLKHEAIKNLDSMFRIPEGFSSGATNRIVDCIVSAAILEVSMLMNIAAKGNKS